MPCCIPPKSSSYPPAASHPKILVSHQYQSYPIPRQLINLGHLCCYFTCRRPFPIQSLLRLRQFYRWLFHSFWRSHQNIFELFPQGFTLKGSHRSRCSSFLTQGLPIS